MRILHVISDTDRRGAQVFATDLHDEMTRRGVESHVVALTAGHVGGISVDELAERRWSLEGWLSLRRLMGQVDVTIAHGSSTLAACRLASLGTQHRWFYRQISDTWYWAGTWGRRTRVSWYMRGSQSVVCLSGKAAEDVAANLGVSRSKLAVVPNGVPGDRFPPPSPADRARSRAEFGIELTAKVVAAVAALVPEKGIAVAIDALADLPADTVLLIAGDGPERRNLESRAEKWGSQVRFVGQVAAAISVYHAADVVVLPSLGGDSMPATLIEAALCGLPAVATEVGSIADVIVDGRTGFILRDAVPRDVARALAASLADTDGPRRLGPAARKRAADLFEIRPVTDQWLAVLNGAPPG